MSKRFLRHLKRMFGKKRNDSVYVGKADGYNFFIISEEEILPEIDYQEFVRIFQDHDTRDKIHFLLIKYFQNLNVAFGALDFRGTDEGKTWFIEMINDASKFENDYTYIGEANGTSFKIQSDIKIPFEIDYQVIAKFLQNENHGQINAEALIVYFNFLFERANFLKKEISGIKHETSDEGKTWTIELSKNTFKFIS